MAKIAKITIPTETPLLVEARARLRQARAFREEAQVKHQQALDLYRSQSAGTRSTITAADVDKLALEIGPLIDAEEEAEAAYRQAYADHHAEATRSLKAPLAGFQRELVEAYTRLAALIAEGVRVEKEAVRAGVTLPSAAPGVCAQIDAAAMPTLRKLLKAGGIIEV